MRIVWLLGALFFAACSSPYNLTDRVGGVFAVENIAVELGQKEVEKGGELKYRVGGATVNLRVADIVSLAMPNAEPTFFDGRVFYPATVILEDTLSVPKNGYICVEGTLAGKSAGREFRIPMANVKELVRAKEEK